MNFIFIFPVCKICGEEILEGEDKEMYEDSEVHTECIITLEDVHDPIND